MTRLIKPLWLTLFVMVVLTMASCNEDTVDAKFYGSIKGIVTAEKGGAPMEGVSVSTSPATETYITASDGMFDIKNVEVGDYTVTLKKEGYTVQNVTVKVVADETRNADTQMVVADNSGDNPAIPVYASPANGTKNQTRTVKLKWYKVKTSEKNPVKYDVKLYTGNNDVVGEIVKANFKDTIITLTGLKFDTAYEWQIIAKDKNMDETPGPLWKFSTEKFPENGYLFVRSNKETGRDIFSWDLNKEHLVKLTSWNGDEIWPQISPNQRKIAFLSNKEGDYHIYTMDRKGRNVQQISSEIVTGDWRRASGFCWSPGGSKLLYVNNKRLDVINDDGTALVQLASAPTGYEFKSCAWTNRFGGKSEEKIVALVEGDMPYDNKIFLINSETGELELELLGNVEGTLSNPKFSVDGKKVIYSWDTPSEFNDGRQLNAFIYSINVDGSENTKLSGTTSSSGGTGTGTGTTSTEGKKAGTNDLQASSSELGGKIIFLNIANNGKGVKNIYTMNEKDGSSRSKIIENGEMPNWFNP